MTSTPSSSAVPSLCEAACDRLHTLRCVIPYDGCARVCEETHLGERIDLSCIAQGTSCEQLNVECRLDDGGQLED